MRAKVTTLLSGAALLAGMSVVAQTAAPPNPLDSVPDKMPFDIPYGAPIAL